MLSASGWFAMFLRCALVTLPLCTGWHSREHSRVKLLFCMQPCACGGSRVLCDSHDSQLRKLMGLSLAQAPGKYEVFESSGLIYFKHHWSECMLLNSDFGMFPISMCVCVCLNLSPITYKAARFYNYIHEASTSLHSIAWHVFSSARRLHACMRLIILK